MADSLQDQLKQLGLADEKQARKARQNNKKNKPRKPSRRGQSTPDPRAAEARQARAEKAERDRQTESRHQARRRAKETAARIRQIVETNRVTREQGEVVYRFTRGRKIKEVWLSQDQHRRLADGELALVSAGQTYDLVPKATAGRIQDIDDKAVLVLNQPADEAAQGDDPYADFPVPDDLMW